MDEVFSGRVAVIGLGYIGLPTAVALATRGIEVVGVDVNEDTVDAVSQGGVPFVEPDLAIGVSGAVSMGRLTASTKTPEADAFIIAVPTPFRDGHMADLTYVREAVEQIAPRLHGGEIIVLESTSPPGTAESVSHWIADLRPDLIAPHASEGVPDYYVAHFPERVLPDRIMIEMVANDRIIGGVTRRCAEKAATGNKVFSQVKAVLMDAASAEIAKLVENAYRDVDIAFAPHHVAARVVAKTELFGSPTVACVELTYKADVDGMRESPALHIVEDIAALPDLDLRVSEPFLNELPA
jgi:UDP-N-acetyl-D-mannosaminuronic acid dehydrogenase